MKPNAILIAGPTASGKSDLAIQIAKRMNGRIINADSMQIYSILQELTARPDASEMDGVEHVMFGHVSPDTSYSVAQWLVDAAGEMKATETLNQTPVFVGGTGLYYKALLEGLSDVPQIDPAIRRSLRDQSLVDLPGLYGALKTEDHENWLALEASDSQRIVRALEVVRSTGKPLSFWQNQKKAAPLLDASKCLKIILSPPRELLHYRIEKRFHQMVEKGALDEVRALLALGLSDEMPAMRAIGVKQLISVLKSETTIEEAIELSIIATRQYAKRQSTWFRHQLGEGWVRCEATQSALDLLQVEIHL